ncbi:MAG: bifunctional riboflavin kinase/FAD synthetase [Proteobacteria bacterium]|nr:bifunctional riboflavin kinase/FAD synthetase [Pseudomonadota bacterium]
MNRLSRDVAGPCLAPRGSAVCIGAFDGVHRGHRAVLAAVGESARNAGLRSVAVSFAPIPRVFLAREAAVAQLTAAGERIGRLFGTGIEHVLMLRFNAKLAAMSARDFVEQVLVRRLAARRVWVGKGFRFGHGRTGDLGLLRELGQAHGFEAGEVPAFEWEGERVSSTRIRGLLASGDFDGAARRLGRRFGIGGHVVRGAQLGRKLGYPTANLRLGSRVSPVAGVFAVRVHGVQAQSMPGVASLGTRPTVDGTEVLLEAHLFDFDGDLYGKKIEVEFVEKLRDEERFSSLDAMVKQIDLDAQAARRILGQRTTATAGATL